MLREDLLLLIILLSVFVVGSSKMFTSEFPEPGNMVKFMENGSLQMLLSLRMLRWGNYPGLSRWFNLITWIHNNRRERQMNESERYNPWRTWPTFADWRWRKGNMAGQGLVLCLHPSRKWETGPFNHKELNSASNQWAGNRFSPQDFRKGQSPTTPWF